MVEFISSWSGNLGRIGGGVVTMVLHGGGAHSRRWCFLDVVIALSYHPRMPPCVNKYKRISRGYVSSIVVSPYHTLWLLSAPHY